jgi:CRISPR-associated exonuclease Cas4
MMTLPWVIASIGLVGAFGLMLLLVGRSLRQRWGLGAGQTVTLDDLTLTSSHLGLTGRPDRLVKTHGVIIPEEWKSSQRLRPWHEAQMGVYFLLIEQQMRVRPTHGFLVCGDGTRHRIENTERLRQWVLELAGDIRRARAAINQPISVAPKPGQCRPCGQLANCGQALLPSVYKELQRW